MGKRTRVRVNETNAVFPSSPAAASSSVNFSGKTTRISIIETTNNTAKKIHATAAACNVLSFW
jgi:hypothetical protein